MSEDVEKCILCHSICDIYRQAMNNYTEYVCQNCGDFAINDHVRDKSMWMKSMMYFYLRHKRPHNDKIVFFVPDIRQIVDTEAIYIDIRMLSNLYPQILSERIDMVLLNFGIDIKVLGDDFVLPGPDDLDKYYAFFIVDDRVSNKPLSAQIYATIAMMEEYDYIRHKRVLGDNLNSYILTAEGWRRLGELQSLNQSSPQAFLAMAFRDDMKDARRSIMQAITDNGYLPVVIDEKEHNNQIVPEIFFEIGRSMFVIADLTHHRNGVYYEAGYAQALNKEVIVSCRDSDFSDRHFDIAQKNIIRWSDEEELYARLLRRIESTVGKRN